MSSGVVSTPLLSGLSLNGAKVTILTPQHRDSDAGLFSLCMTAHQQQRQTTGPAAAAAENESSYYPSREREYAKYRLLPNVDRDTKKSLERSTASNFRNSDCVAVTPESNVLNENLAVFIPTTTCPSISTVTDVATTKNSIRRTGNLGERPIESLSSDHANSSSPDTEPFQVKIIHDDNCAYTAKSYDNNSQNMTDNSSLPHNQGFTLPHPPTELKKKKGRRRSKTGRKNKQMKSRRSSLTGLKKTNPQETGTKISQTVGTAASRASSGGRLALSSTPAIIYTHGAVQKSNTVPTMPAFHQSNCRQRQAVCQAIYTRHAYTMPSRSNTLPTVSNSASSQNNHVENAPRQNTSVTSAVSCSSPANVISLRLSSQNSRYEVGPPCKSTTSEQLGRLIKIYFSEKQSGSLRDQESGLEFPCAPPATPTPDQLRRYSYVPCMNDIKAQRAVKVRLQGLEKAEKKRKEKFREEQAKAEKLSLKDKEKDLRMRQRQEIYALNKVMTELEYSRFMVFCRDNNINPA